MKKRTTVEKWGRGGNVHENKGSYPFKAGMYMKTRKIMFSVEISHNIHIYPPTRRCLRGGGIFDIVICEVKRRKGGLDLALAEAPRKNFFLEERRGNVYENKGPESAGINRQEAENERFSRGRSSDPLGPEFCAGRREAHSEA